MLENCNKNIFLFSLCFFIIYIYFLSKENIEKNSNDNQNSDILIKNEEMSD